MVQSHYPKLSIPIRIRPDLQGLLLYPLTPKAVAYKKKVPILYIEEWEKDLLHQCNGELRLNNIVDNIVKQYEYSAISKDKVLKALKQFIRYGYLTLSHSA